MPPNVHRIRTAQRGRYRGGPASAGGKALARAGARRRDGWDKLLLSDPDLGLRLLNAGDGGADIEVEAAAQRNQLVKMLGSEGDEIVGRCGARSGALLIDE